MIQHAIRETKMMVLSTLLIAVLVLAVLWFFILRRIPWRWASYLIVLLVAALFIWSGTVHFVYTGIEVAALGCFLVWWNPRFSNPPPKA